MGLSFLLLILSSAFALNNGLGKTPQMGWSTWNHFACNINATVITSAASAMVSSGLSAKGYQYINIDDCWALHQRNANDQLVPDPTKFPQGISGVANYVHSLGLKLGIYSDAGTNTCQGQPGSLDNEQTDANSFASWEIDYLKYDNCNNQNVPPKVRYTDMRVALSQCGRSIFYSICDWGEGDVWTWGNITGNSWRTTQDIKDVWQSMMLNFYLNSMHSQYAGPGGWNDPDMLEVGNGGMNFEEYKSHFSLWALSKAPLIIGCDLTQMSNETLYILGNSDVIAINQDPLGIQATCRLACDYQNYLTGVDVQVWAGQLSGGSQVVALMNWSVLKRNYHLNLRDIAITGNATIYELWDKTTTSGNFIAATGIPPHGIKIYKVTPTS
ncbi:unnamed protein product [Blepharisma stoltei]|uniref:Alpha-galactosidase n=1 Tax=Blepharisma stoltei TaxID=1481888 RepID=A0AAU9JW65_9CILI|nr:unnamed protein product [Blepharisma stoltei]